MESWEVSVGVFILIIQPGLTGSQGEPGRPGPAGAAGPMGPKGERASSLHV